MNISILCIIPARGGSKGLPGKNIRDLAGEPLISHSINVAKSSNMFDEIMVNTDSDDIAIIAKQYGASVPFIRPAELAGDKSQIMDTYLFTIEYYRKKGIYFDAVMVLLPTAPLRNVEDIVGAINLMKSRKADSVVTVCEVDHPPFWMNTLEDDCSMKTFFKEEYRHKNRQELPTYYRINGAIYLAMTETLIRDRDWYSSEVYAYKMPRERSVDIDSVLDFKIAEMIIAEKGELK